MGYMKEFLKGLNDKGISIPITERMIQAGMERATKDKEGVPELKLELIENEICISGSVKKMLLTVPFKVYLVPVEAKDRRLQFQVRKMEPLNQDWINSKIFNRAPLVYEKGNIYLDLNSFEAVKKVRFGKLKHFRIEEKTLWVGIGL